MKTKYYISIQASYRKGLGKNLHILNEKKIYQFIGEYIYTFADDLKELTQYSY